MTERRTRTRAAQAAPDTSSELAGTIAALRKNFGDATVQKGSNQTQPNRISTGSFLLDFATLGGVLENRVNMFVGERSSGKTTMANKVVASIQQMYPDRYPVIVDIEGTHDAVWSSKQGVDQERLYVLKPETGESAVDMADALCRTREVSLLVIDSIAALTPMKEIDDSAEDQHVGLQARLVGRMIRKLTSALIAERNRGHDVTILFLNQYRMKVGVTYGDPRTLPGGKSLEFCTSLQVSFTNKETMGKSANDIEIVDENEHAFRITKNKSNGGLRTGEFILRRQDKPNGYPLYEGEIDDAATMLAYAKKFGLYHGGGGSWTLEVFDQEYKFGKAQEAIDAMYQDRDLYWRLRNSLIQQQAITLGMPEDFVASFNP